jgi:translation initiation factor IF-1
MKIIKTNAKIKEITDRYNVSATLEDGAEMNVSISPSLKQYDGKEFKEGDSIIVQMSPFDTTVGRLHRDTFLYLDLDDDYEA